MTPQQELELFNFVKSTNLQTESGMSVMKKFIEFFIETDIKLNEDAVNKHYTFFESLFSMVSQELGELNDRLTNEEIEKEPEIIIEIDEKQQVYRTNNPSGIGPKESEDISFVMQFCFGMLYDE